MSTEQQGSITPYFVPNPSIWPNVINWGLFFALLGFVLKINALGGTVTMLVGLAVVLVGSFAWIADVASEKKQGLFRKWEDRSFRVGMAYFIGAELMFFASFIGALFYIRVIALPDLQIQHVTPDVLGWPVAGHAEKGVSAMSPFGAPLVNTLMLLISAAFMIWANAGVAKGNRGQMFAGLIVSGLIGISFMFAQLMEYGHVAAEYGVLVGSGAYGTMFYALTAFHGIHLLVGLIILITILLRAFHGHFSEDSHFGVEGTMWYWNFIVVIPGLLIYIYFYLA